MPLWTRATMPRRSTGGDELQLARLPGGATVTAAALRRDLTGRRLRDVRELGLALLVDDSALRALLDLVLSVRVFRRPARRHTVAEVLRQLRAGNLSRWARVTLQQCFGVYCALRRSVPQAVTTITFGR